MGGPGCFYLAGNVDPTNKVICPSETHVCCVVISSWPVVPRERGREGRGGVIRVVDRHRTSNSLNIIKEGARITRKINTSRLYKALPLCSKSNANAMILLSAMKCHSTILPR